MATIKQGKRIGCPKVVWMESSCGILVLGMQSLMAAKCTDIGDGWDGVIPIVAVLTSSYFGQLEAYYTGKVKQPLFNGASDGSLLLFSAYLVLGIIGDSILEVPVANKGTPEELDLKDLASLIIIIGQVVTVIRHIKNILENNVGIEEDPEIHCEEVVFPILLVQIVGYFSTIASICLLPLMGKRPMIDYPA